jgi:hypothetical protein
VWAVPPDDYDYDDDDDEDCGGIGFSSYYEVLISTCPGNLLSAVSA